VESGYDRGVSIEGYVMQTAFFVMVAFSLGAGFALLGVYFGARYL
jgi:hypothetical protein